MSDLVLLCLQGLNISIQMTQANGEDPDEMLHWGISPVSSLFALTKTIFRERNTSYLEIITCDPSNYIMYHAKCNVLNQKESMRV